MADDLPVKILRARKPEHGLAKRTMTSREPTNMNPTDGAMV
jgi:hypothetical protein